MNDIEVEFTIPDEDIEIELNDQDDEFSINSITAEDFDFSIFGVKGDKGDKGDQGIQGIQGEKGDKGDPGAIKFEIVVTLPTTGSDDTIYLVPITPDTTGNNYAEYIYINGQWELLGKIGVQVDLTDYVKNTDYATNNTGGVIKIFSSYNLGIYNGGIYPLTKTYAQYESMGGNTFIGKDTLENVIAGKDLTTKAYVDGLVGDINSAIDSINGEVI